MLTQAPTSDLLGYLCPIKSPSFQKTLMTSPSVATRTLFFGGQHFFCGGQNFWVGLLFSEFSVDLKKKKKGHLAKLFYLFPSLLFVGFQKKKKHYLETAIRKRGA